MIRENKLNKVRINFKGLSIVVISIFLLNLFFPIGVFAKDIYVEDEVDVIVLYKEEVPENKKLFGIFNTSNHKNESVLSSLPIKTMTVPMSELNRLKNDPNVVSVSLDQEVELAKSKREKVSTIEFETQRTLRRYDWDNDMIKGFDAWDDGYRGKGIDVAVLDTGFSNHPDITYAGGFSAHEGVAWNLDGDGHGTHVAGIIGAKEGTLTQGIAPEANVYGVKVFNQIVGREHIGTISSAGEFSVDLKRELETNEDLVIYQKDAQNESDRVTFKAVYAGEDELKLLELSRTSSGTLGNVSNLVVSNEGRVIQGIIDGDFESYNTVVVQDNHSYNSAPLSIVMEGLDWAIDNDMDIVNMSIGSHMYNVKCYAGTVLL